MLICWSFFVLSQTPLFLTIAPHPVLKAYIWMVIWGALWISDLPDAKAMFFHKSSSSKALGPSVTVFWQEFLKRISLLQISSLYSDRKDRLHCWGQVTQEFLTVVLGFLWRQKFRSYILHLFFGQWQIHVFWVDDHSQIFYFLSWN